MSEYGLWVYNDDGTERFGTSMQTIKFFGKLTVNAGNSPGSVTDPRFTLFGAHKGFWAVIEGGAGSAIPPNAPVFTLSGNTLSWSYPAGASKVAQTIIYGAAGIR